MAAKGRFEEAAWQVAHPMEDCQFFFPACSLGVKGVILEMHAVSQWCLLTQRTPRAPVSNRTQSVARMGKLEEGTCRHSGKYSHSESLQGLSALLPTRRSGCLTNGGIIYFSYIQQIFVKCLSPPSVILGIDSRLPLHVIHKCPVVLVIWSTAGRWQRSRAATSTVWRGSIDRRPKHRLQTQTRWVHTVWPWASGLTSLC